MKSKLKKWSLNVIIFFIILLMLEIILRFANVTGRNQEEVLHPIVQNELTYKDYIPNSTFIRKPGRNDEFGEVINHINSIGIRGPELEKKKGFRVLNIGDSYVQAEELEFDKTFGEILNNEFKDSIEFISHGISSWAPTPMFSWILHKGLDLQPDEINLFLCINDFYRENISNSSDANYRKSAIYENGIPIKYNVKTKSTNNMFIKIIAGIELVRLPVLVYRKVKAAYKTANSKDVISDDKSTVNINLKDFLELKLLEKNDSLWTEDFKNEIDNTIDVVVKMNEFLSNKNIVLNVYMIPLGFCWENETVGGKASYGLQEKEIITQTGFENYLYDVLNNKFKIKTYLLHKEINTYKSKNPSEKLYFNFDGHWNNNGHRAIARIMSNNIKKNK